MVLCNHTPWSGGSFHFSFLGYLCAHFALNMAFDVFKQRYSSTSSWRRDTGIGMQLHGTQGTLLPMLQLPSMSEEMPTCLGQNSGCSGRYTPCTLIKIIWATCGSLRKKRAVSPRNCRSWSCIFGSTCRQRHRTKCRVLSDTCPLKVSR